MFVAGERQRSAQPESASPTPPTHPHPADWATHLHYSAYHAAHDSPTALPAHSRHRLTLGGVRPPQSSSPVPVSPHPPSPAHLVSPRSPTQSSAAHPAQSRPPIVAPPTPPRPPTPPIPMTMDAIVGVFTSLPSTQKRKDDDFADRLSNRHSIIVLVVFAIVVSMHQYVGDPIKCWAPVHFTGTTVFCRCVCVCVCVSVCADISVL